MSEVKKSKSAWEIIQSVILLLTPVLVTVMGFIFNRSLNQIESQIANVSAMKPFMEMIADPDTTKSQMGAYAIYLLKKDDDPQIAAQMILAPGKQHLLDVLVDIGNRDTAIKSYVNHVLDNLDLSSVDVDSLSMIQKNALKIIDKIDMQTANEQFVDEEEVAETNEWLYLGNFSSGSNSDWIIDRSPEIGKEYTLIKAANVRDGKPKKENGYRLPPFIKVAKKGSKIRLDTLTVDKKGHRWAKVKFIE